MMFHLLFVKNLLVKFGFCYRHTCIPDDQSVALTQKFLELLVAAEFSHVVSKGFYEIVQIYLLVFDKKFSSYKPQQTKSTPKSGHAQKEELFNSLMSPLVALLGDLSTAFEGSFTSVELMNLRGCLHRGSPHWASRNNANLLKPEEIQVRMYKFLFQVTQMSHFTRHLALSSYAIELVF